MRQKVVICFLIFSFWPLNNCFAQEKVNPMDVINGVCNCYVASEIMTLYSLPLSNDNVFSMYYNYDNASSILLKKEYDPAVVPLTFMQHTRSKRKTVLKQLAEMGYEPKFFEEFYNLMECDKYYKVIPLSSYSVE